MKVGKLTTMNKQLASWRTASVWILICGALSLISAAVAPLPSDPVNSISQTRIYISLATQILSWIGVPLLAWLVYRRVRILENRSGSFYSAMWQYAVFVTVLAFICEAPYDFVCTGQWWNSSSQNPIFAVVVAVVARIAWELVRSFQGNARVTMGVFIVVDALAVAFAMQTLISVVAVTLAYLMWEPAYAFEHGRIFVSRQRALVCIGLLSGLTPAVGVWMVSCWEKKTQNKSAAMEQGGNGRTVRSHPFFNRWLLWWAFPALLLVGCLVRFIVIRSLV